MKLFEWQNLITYSDIVWYDMEEGEKLMTESDSIFRKFVGRHKELIIRSTVNGSGSAIFNIFRDEMYDILEKKVFVTGGNKFLFGSKISILIPLVICNIKEEECWIKSGVIKPIRLHNALAPTYKRIPDVSFNPAEASPGAAITKYIRYNNI